MLVSTSASTMLRQQQQQQQQLQQQIQQQILLQQHQDNNNSSSNNANSHNNNFNASRFQHQRPLPLSDASSTMSASQPFVITYGRHVRPTSSITPVSLGYSTHKSQTNLASILAASNTLSHHHLGGGGHFGGAGAHQAPSPVTFNHLGSHHSQTNSHLMSSAATNTTATNTWATGVQAPKGLDPHEHHYHYLSYPSHHYDVPHSQSHQSTNSFLASSTFSALRRAKQRVRSLAYEYRTLAKCSFIVLLLALSTLSIIKFTLFNGPPQALGARSSADPTSSMIYHQQQQQQQLALSPVYSSSSASASSSPSASSVSSSNSQQQATSNSNVLNQAPPIYSFPKFDTMPVATSPEEDQSEAAEGKSGARLSKYRQKKVAKEEPDNNLAVAADPISRLNVNAASQRQQQPQQQQQQQQDMLKSKLLIGEFVIVNQNYVHSAAQKSLLAERIVRLMDQVFLATDVRRVYSRMEVTNIRPHLPSGIVVDCSIVLSHSIAYAAQQFGIALYESLSKSQERLANQADYIIDKNSIRFNTVPDKDLKSGIVPPGLIPASVSRELDASVAPSGGQPPIANIDGAEQLNLVVWSEWSQWSSCVDKNGLCDPTRLHSRLRKCVAQHTGEKVDATQCKARFNLQDRELEVEDCSASCAQAQPLAHAQQQAEAHVMSDAPSVIGPQTAPSVLVAGSAAESLFGGVPSAGKPLKGGAASAGALSSSPASIIDALYAHPSAVTGSQSSTERSETPEPLLTSSLATPTLVPPLEQLAQAPQARQSDSEQQSPQQQQQQQQRSEANQQQQQQAQPQVQNSQLSCSNCTSGEICLLLISQKVPFCAKVKEAQDESGCGGWCKAPGQLCQPVGQNAFKCIHDSECLAEEWRCHDSACIPLSKRCDGHSNCYDSSDERDCPM